MVIETMDTRAGAEITHLWIFFCILPRFRCIITSISYSASPLESLPMFMNITCPSCGERFRVPERSLGQLVVCPKCSQPFQCGTVAPPSLKARPLKVEEPARVQETPHARQVSIQPSAIIHYRCGRCQKSLESPAHMAGQKINCPDCGQRLQIPSTSSVPPDAVVRVYPVNTTLHQAQEPILPVLPASPPQQSAEVRREHCLECGVDVTQRTRIQTCPHCGSSFCSARCYRDHCYHAHPGQQH
jgi:lysine biosynthesis protein LysW